MDKEDVAHIYNGILLSHKKNEIELFVVRWMDLESVITYFFYFGTTVFTMKSQLTH